VVLEADEFVARKRAASRLEAHVYQVGDGDAPLFQVIGGYRHAVGVVVIDDHAEILGGKGGLGEAGDDGQLGRGRMGDGLRQQRDGERVQQAQGRQASCCTHSRTSAGPR